MIQKVAKYYLNNLLNELEDGENIDLINFINSRGLTIPLIIEKQIGFAPDEWYKFPAELSDISIEDRLTLGLVKKNRMGTYNFFRNRVMFSIFNEDKKVIGFTSRIINKNDKPKYLNSPDSEYYDKSKSLYGIETAIKSILYYDYVILVEGQIDQLSLYKSGIKNCVAISGTNLTEQQIGILSKYTMNVYLAYDNDKAGQKATSKHLPILFKNGFSVKVVNLLNASDPDEFITNYGALLFKEQILNSVDINDIYNKLDIDRKVIFMRNLITKKSITISVLDNFINNLDNSSFLAPIVYLEYIKLHIKTIAELFEFCYYVMIPSKKLNSVNYWLLKYLTCYVNYEAMKLPEYFDMLPLRFDGIESMDLGKMQKELEFIRLKRLIKKNKGNLKWLV